MLSRIRRITIAALARKLLVALWRYTTLGELPKCESAWNKDPV
jgi:hypothetical protein